MNITVWDITIMGLQYNPVKVTLRYKCTIILALIRKKLQFWNAAMLFICIIITLECDQTV